MSRVRVVRFAGMLAFVSLTVACAPRQAPSEAALAPAVAIVEATIGGLQGAMREGRITCRQIVRPPELFPPLAP